MESADRLRIDEDSKKVGGRSLPMLRLLSQSMAHFMWLAPNRFGLFERGLGNSVNIWRRRRH